VFLDQLVGPEERARADEHRDPAEEQLPAEVRDHRTEREPEQADVREHDGGVEAAQQLVVDIAPCVGGAAVSGDRRVRRERVGIELVRLVRPRIGLALSGVVQPSLDRASLIAHCLVVGPKGEKPTQSIASSSSTSSVCSHAAGSAAS